MKSEDDLKGYKIIGSSIILAATILGAYIALLKHGDYFVFATFVVLITLNFTVSIWTGESLIAQIKSRWFTEDSDAGSSLQKADKDSFEKK